MPEERRLASRRSVGDLCLEQVYLAVTTPLGLFWLARLLFVGCFGLFASTGVGFMATVRGPQPGVQVILVVLSTGWFFLPFLGVLTGSTEARRVELLVTDEGAKLASPLVNAASTLDWVRARRFGGRLLVTVAGQTCALRDADDDVADLLARDGDPGRNQESSASFEAPAGSLVSITSAPGPSLTIRGWLAVKPYWWALPLLLLCGALVMANLPPERAGVVVPTARLATLCALVAGASVVQDAAFGVARALDGVTRRRARGQQLSVTREASTCAPPTRRSRRPSTP